MLALTKALPTTRECRKGKEKVEREGEEGRDEREWREVQRRRGGGRGSWWRGGGRGKGGREEVVRAC